MPNTATLIQDARLIINPCEAMNARPVRVYDINLDGTGDLTVATISNAASNPNGVLAVIGFSVGTVQAGVFKLQSGTGAGSPATPTTQMTFPMAANSVLHEGVKVICPYVHFMTNRSAAVVDGPRNDGALVVSHSGAGAGANVVRARLWLVEVIPTVG